MDKVEITRAVQFVAALAGLGKQVNPQDVKIGRLNVNNERENGYVCFYASVEDKIYYLKAFKGKTERVVKCGTADEVSVKKEYVPICSFISAYHDTSWKVMKGDEGIYLVEQKK